MEREQGKIKQISEGYPPIEGTRIGRIVHIDASGQAFVDFPGNYVGPVVARTTTSAKTAILRAENSVGREVLLTFANNDPHLPIILDTMYSLIDELVESEVLVFEKNLPQEVALDGKRISFEAAEEIVLQCGKASITLTKAGKVLIKGEYVLSHSSGENRIRGGSVSVN